MTVTHFALLILASAGFFVVESTTTQPASVPATMPTILSDKFKIGELLHADDFADTSRWSAEFEKPGHFDAKEGKLVIDVPAGFTAWFKPKLSGPVLIEYDAKVIQAGGPNERVSDLNCFWMATDPKHPDDLLSNPRSGKFADYNDLLTYYVGLGGNGNTTTRFRRYIGDKENRPLLPEHDLKEPASLIMPNVWQHITLVACDNWVQFYRDGKRMFELDDASPYTAGWFALRTVTNRMEVGGFRVHRLQKK